MLDTDIVDLGLKESGKMLADLEETNLILESMIKLRVETLAAKEKA